MYLDTIKFIMLYISNTLQIKVIQLQVKVIQLQVKVIQLQVKVK